MILKPTLYPKFMLLALCMVVAVILYFINVGFDINDEGYYFLGYDREQDVFFSTTGFHFLVRFFPSSDGIIMNRIYRLLLHFAGSYFLFRALFDYFEPKGNKWIGFFWILLGSLASYVYAPNSLSYNTINLFLLELSLSVLLILVRTQVKSIKYFWMAGMLMVLLSLVIFNKASSGVLVMGVFSIYYFFTDLNSVKIKFVNVIILGSIVFACSALWFCLSFGQNIITYFHEIENNRLINISDHQGLIYHLKQLFLNPIIQSKKQLLFVSLLLLVFFIERKYQSKWPRLSHLSEVFYVLICVSLFTYYLKYYACGSGAEIFTAVLIFLALVAGFTRNDWVKQNVNILILIFCLPLIGFAGSNVSPFEGMNHYLVFYFALIFLIGNQFDFKFLKFFYFLSAFFILIRFVYFPFENPPLNTLAFKVNSVRESNVILVKEEVGNEMKAFNGFVEKANLSNQVAYLNISPGILFLANKVNFGTLYYNSPAGLNYYLNFLLERDTASTMDYVFKSPEEDTLKSAIFASFIKEKKKLGFQPDTLLREQNYMKIRFVRNLF